MSKKITMLLVLQIFAVMALFAREDGLNTSVTNVPWLPTVQYCSSLQLRSAIPVRQVTAPCPPRFAVPVNSKNSVFADFNFKQKPTEPLFCYIEGCGTIVGSTVQVSVNGKTVFSGASPFYAIEWNRMVLTLKPEIMNAGKNTVEVKLVNAKPNHTVYISEMTMIDPNGDFKRLASGHKNNYWKTDSKKDIVKAVDGKVKFISNSPKGSILSFFNGHQFPKIAVEPGTRVRLTVKASGNSSFRFSLNAYYSYQRDSKRKQKVYQIGWMSGMYQRAYISPVYKLTQEEKTYTWEVNTNNFTGFIYPTITLMSNGELTASDFKIELLKQKETAKVQNYELRNIRLNKPEGFYNIGEELVCTAQLFKAGKPAVAADGTLRCILKWEGKEIKKLDFPCNGQPVTIRYKADKPGWFYIGFQVLDKDGEIFFHPGRFLPQSKKNHLSEVGAIWAADKIKTACERPADFDEFWKKQRAILDASPMKAKVTKLNSGAAGIELYALEISSPTDRPVTAYLAKPANAKAKSLPLQIDYLSWTWCDANRNFAIQAAKNGALGMAVSWHGFTVGKPRQFYIDSCRKYFDPHKNIADRNKWSFRDVYVRVLRALDYAKQRPEWNGKDLIVMGGSLGGTQSIVAAALDPAVSLAVISVPGFSEFQGDLAGRKRSIPVNDKYATPQIFREMAYFDMVHFAQLLKCEVYFCTGFTDELCPPSNVYAIFNGIPASTTKIMTTNPYTGHYSTTKNVKGNERLERFFKQTTVREYPGSK